MRLHLFDCVGGDGVEIDAVKHVGTDAGRAGAVDPPLGVRAPEFRVGVDVVVRVGLKRDDPEDTFRVDRWSLDSSRRASGMACPAW